MTMSVDLMLAGASGTAGLGGGLWYALRQVGLVRGELNRLKVHVAEDYASKRHLEEYVVKPLRTDIQRLEKLILNGGAS